MWDCVFVNGVKETSGESTESTEISTKCLFVDMSRRQSSLECRTSTLPRLSSGFSICALLICQTVVLIFLFFYLILIYYVVNLCLMGSMCNFLAFFNDFHRYVKEIGKKREFNFLKIHQWKTFHDIRSFNKVNNNRFYGLKGKKSHYFFIISYTISRSNIVRKKNDNVLQLLPSNGAPSPPAPQDLADAKLSQEVDTHVAQPAGSQQWHFDSDCS